jgi:hypothetical protein
MGDDDDSGSAKKKSNKTHRSGGELGDDEPKLDGYERYVFGGFLSDVYWSSCLFLVKKGRSFYAWAYLTVVYFTIQNDLLKRAMTL